MKKAIIFALVAFLVSLGGTTAFMVKRGVAKAQAENATALAHADSLKAVAARADSTRHDSTAKDSLHADSTRHDTANVPVAADSGRTPMPVAVAVKPSGVSPESHATPVDPVAKAAAYKQVARVLSAMKPPEAAKVLGLLSDDEVEGILRSVGPRQAADFLTNLSKERAAVLSRRLLVPKAREQSR